MEKLKKGFTLLELMAVVLILSTLVVVAVFSYKKYIQQAYKQEAVAFLMDLKLKQETYFQTYSQYVDTTGGFYPTTYKDGLFKWEITCPNNSYAGWCVLGIPSAGTETQYQYVTEGWAPGDTGPTIITSIPNQDFIIYDPSRRWWYAVARTYLDKKNKTRELYLFISNEFPEVIERWP